MTVPFLRPLSTWAGLSDLVETVNLLDHRSEFAFRAHRDQVAEETTQLSRWTSRIKLGGPGKKLVQSICSKSGRLSTGDM